MPRGELGLCARTRRGLASFPSVAMRRTDPRSSSSRIGVQILDERKGAEVEFELPNCARSMSSSAGMTFWAARAKPQADPQPSSTSFCEPNRSAGSTGCARRDASGRRKPGRERLERCQMFLERCAMSVEAQRQEAKT